MTRRLGSGSGVRGQGEEGAGARAWRRGGKARTRRRGPAHPLPPGACEGTAPARQPPPPASPALHPPQRRGSCPTFHLRKGVTGGRASPAARLRNGGGVRRGEGGQRCGTAARPRLLLLLPAGLRPVSAAEAAAGGSSRSATRLSQVVTGDSQTPEQRRPRAPAGAWHRAADCRESRGGWSRRPAAAAGLCGRRGSNLSSTLLWSGVNH